MEESTSDQSKPLRCVLSLPKLLDQVTVGYIHEEDIKDVAVYILGNKHDRITRGAPLEIYFDELRFLQENVHPSTVEKVLPHVRASEQKKCVVFRGDLGLEDLPGEINQALVNAGLKPIRTNFHPVFDNNELRSAILEANQDLGRPVEVIA